MRGPRIVLTSLLVFVLGLFVALAAGGEACAAPGRSAALRKRPESYGRSFYRNLSKRLSRDREAYPDLSDEAFANFRAVTTTGMGEGKLYRSSSPVKAWGNRNAIADNAARAAGVRTFVNLADTEREMRTRRVFAGSYYSSQTIVGLGLGVKFQGEGFRAGLARGVRFMAAGEPPFLVHCDLGKDRAGFVCAVLECLMGASAEEVAADYLVSFYNYFGIRPGTRDYDFVANNEIRAALARAFGLKSIVGADLAAAAERYLLDIGVPAGDIAALRDKLGP